MSGGLAEGVLSGDRRALARAITLVESTLEDHRAEARFLVEELMPTTGGAIRVGLSGAPGTGKSTLIEALGMHAIGIGQRVAVLAVDPSSTRSGGSILGDKTRMSELGRHPDAYIRPSPSGGTLGGVARRTREALLVCEAAGFDVVLVETVGVGQSEVDVADLVDLFVLVASPTGGDELQGIKRGIMELADLVVVNKADGDLAAAARRTCGDLRSAMHLLRPKRSEWQVEVLLCSALSGEGVSEVWTTVVTAHRRLIENETLGRVRADQAKAWMWNEITETLLDRLRSDVEVRRRVGELQETVAAGSMSPTTAAQEILAAYRPR